MALREGGNRSAAAAILLGVNSWTGSLVTPGGLAPEEIPMQRILSTKGGLWY